MRANVVPAEEIRDWHGEQVRQLHRLRNRARSVQLALHDEARLHALQEPPRGLFDICGVGTRPDRNGELALVDDLRRDVLGFQRRGPEGHVDRTSGRRRGDLERSPHGQRNALRIADLPGELGELLVDVDLLEAGPWRKHEIVAEDRGVHESSGDHHGGMIAVGVEELARCLGGPGDCVKIDEGRLAGHLVVAVGHGNDEAFVQPHDRLNLRSAGQGVEEANFRGARIREDVLHVRGLELLHEEFSARSGRGAIGAAWLVGRRLRRREITQERLDEAGREAGRHHPPEEATTGEAIVQVFSQELAHRHPPNADRTPSRMISRCCVRTCNRGFCQGRTARR